MPFLILRYVQQTTSDTVLFIAMFDKEEQYYTNRHNQVYDYAVTLT